MRAKEQVLGAFATPDGRWRVEVIRRGRTDWYRVWGAGDNELDWLPLASVERLLGDDYARLQPAPLERSVDREDPAAGVA